MYVDHLLDGAWLSSGSATPLTTTGPLYLRLEVDGVLVRAYYSTDGQTWTHVDTEQLSWEPTSVGVVRHVDERHRLELER